MTVAGPPPRVVLVEPGAAADRPGVATVRTARALRDAGAEVVYGGWLSTVDAVLRTVEQEDPDVVGITVATEPDREFLARVRTALPGLPVLETGPELTDRVARVAGHSPSRWSNDPQ
ncbi:hypothetical protein [Amycolatopsis cihanbeyliensis]|uniref:Methylmalonyl-CoA mutase C-terminal domain/subunit n=1 Tax=Amycolatopsis cihanbeyliensis TaxID=1128664 RepID=A0A542DJ91_AMYCI|nr:hypothetical protein [Amycolatopsis cihanbeyliensis]TQJ03074.1 methylmalonyl-CoA mutase C-terminal domain/subunit [Amycolatopsis cihanbeyliensis]